MSTISAKSGVNVRTEEKKLALHPDGSVELHISSNTYATFWEKVKRSPEHCYMLGVNSKDKNKLNNIIAYLLEEKMLSQVYSGLDTSRLFLSAGNLVPLQKKIANKFKGLKFILVRLNRNGFPKQKYC